MLPGMELMGCQIEVPASIMHHVVKVESSYNPFAIGVVRGRLVRQPASLAEAVATAQMLESRGYNFSLGLAQVNRYNLRRYGLASYEQAFQVCPNLNAGSRILSECHQRAAGDWGKAFSCYYSGNFTTGYRHGYVQKVQASMRAMRAPEVPALAIPLAGDGREAGGRAARRMGAAGSRQEALTPSSLQAVQRIPAQVMPPGVPASPVSVTVPSLVERRGGLSEARELSPLQFAAQVQDAPSGHEQQPVRELPQRPAVAVPTPAKGTGNQDQQPARPSPGVDPAFVF